MLSQQWGTIVWPGSKEALSSVDIITGVAKDVLKRVGQASVWIPGGFEVHPKLVRHVKNRIVSLDKEKGLDWATAEVRIHFLIFFFFQMGDAMGNSFFRCFLYRLWHLVR